MDPVILAAVGTATAVGGGAAGLLGNLFSGQAQSKALKYQAGVAQVNKQIALQNADYERRVGEVQAQQSGLRTAAEIGTTKAFQGASGTAVNTGSNLAVRDSEREIGAENQSIIRANAARRAYGFEIGAVQDETQSQLFRMGASTAKTASYIGASSSVLGAASSVASKWTQAGMVGIGADSSGNPSNLFYGSNPFTPSGERNPAYG